MEAWVDYSDKSVTLSAKLQDQGCTDGTSAFIYVNGKDLRKLAQWLLLAAEKVDPIKHKELDNFQC